MQFIVPWVYGEKQRAVILEEFTGHAARFPDEIVLDAELGALLGGLFYKKEKYRDALERWTRICAATEEKMRAHLGGKVHGETLDGRRVELDGRNVAVELNRSPRCSYGIGPSYSASFGYLSLILEGAKEASEHIAVPSELLNAGATLARRIEGAQKILAIAYPSTFTDSTAYRSRYADRVREVVTPPLITVRSGEDSGRDVREDGIYVTITGIPGLERLYRDARALGLKIYTNDAAAVAGGAMRAVPHAMASKAILLHFARSGWSSVWLSMIYEVPLVIPDFDRFDDPEIYFNNRMIERLGMGIVYRGQELSSILEEAESMRARYRKIKKEIEGQWGTLDGNKVAAEMFVSDFVSL